MWGGWGEVQRGATRGRIRRNHVPQNIAGRTILDRRPSVPLSPPLSRTLSGCAKSLYRSETSLRPCCSSETSRSTSEASRPARCAEPTAATARGPPCVGGDADGGGEGGGGGLSRSQTVRCMVMRRSSSVVDSIRAASPKLWAWDWREEREGAVWFGFRRDREESRASARSPPRPQHPSPPPPRLQHRRLQEPPTTPLPPSPAAPPPAAKPLWRRASPLGRRAL